MHLALILCHTRQEEWVHAAAVRRGHRTVYQVERYVTASTLHMTGFHT